MTPSDADSQREALIAALNQMAEELTQAKSQEGQTIEETEELGFRDFVEGIAVENGLVSVWERSQHWPNFNRAWKSWRLSFNRWTGESRRFPGLKSGTRYSTRYEWMRKQCIEAAKTGRRDKPDFYQNNWMLWFAAAWKGDVEFFQLFANAKRRKTPDPRLVAFSVMQFWMPAALWSCDYRATAALLQAKTKAWGENEPRDIDEAIKGRAQSVRATRKTLRLWHDPKFRITDWKGDEPSLRG
jgi:hypothetical protein